MPGIDVDNKLAHPGLRLDKWHEPMPPDNPPEHVLKELGRVVAALGDEALLQRVRNRCQRAQNPQTVRFTGRTRGPLTLHLSRANAYENAGLCLHPLYGFAYLPGSGLKGMARAYAETIAKAPVTDREAVFGKDVDKTQEGCSGGVVFYDALPAKWPRLMLDIVNNHHREYYAGDGPPADWEDPNPVRFLAIPKDTEFEFAVAPRLGVADGGRLCALAQSWLKGALTWLGAGAKTNAGYGRFQITPSEALPATAERASFNAVIRLASPAFLAGPLQDAADCDLRSATLRGLFRWWWRTLHAGYLTVDELRKMEGLLWGTTEEGGAISLEVVAPQPVQPIKYDRNALKRQHQLPPPPGQRTTQGLFYLAYGMEGNPAGNRPPRYYLRDGSAWEVRILARAVNDWPAALVLDQAFLALCGMSKFGGIGAKCRRGFGSFNLRPTESQPPITVPPNIPGLLQRAAGIRPGTSFHANALSSPSLGAMTIIEIPLGRTNAWQALDRLGTAYQSFAASQKHQPGKLALGLPRRIHSGPRRQDLRHPGDRGRKRHASPLHFRLIKQPDQYWARLTAFHDPQLPNLEESKEYLTEAIRAIGENLGIPRAQQKLMSTS